MEKCTMLMMRSGKRQMTEGMELQIKDEIKTLREKNYKHLGIIGSRHHQTRGRWKKKNKKSISGERVNSTKLNYIARISWKG